MRNILIAALLAGAATPAVAAASGQDDLAVSPRAEPSAPAERPQSRAERVQSRAERVQPRQLSVGRVRSAPAQGADRRQIERGGQPRLFRAPGRAATPQHHNEHSTGSHRGEHREAREEHRELHGTNPSRREHRRYHRQVEREHARDHNSWTYGSHGGSHGDYHHDVETEHRELHAGDPSRREHRAWHRDVSREHGGRHAAWSTNWRSYPYYDWRDYRNRYSSLFYLPGYFDPYRFGYRRFQVGLSIGRSYYNDRYWFDGGRYRLPRAYGPYRWVRYYDDAVLVNIYTGQVVDVIYSFFW